jgi:hypothetical protein
MLIAQARPLFVWDGVEDSPSLQTIRDLLAALPAAGIAPRREGTLGKLSLSPLAYNATGSRFPFVATASSRRYDKGVED